MDTEVSGPIQAGDLRMDLERRLLWRGNEEGRLSPKEFDLLHYFLANPNTPIGYVIAFVVLPRGPAGAATATSALDIVLGTLPRFKNDALTDETQDALWGWCGVGNKAALATERHTPLD